MRAVRPPCAGRHQRIAGDPSPKRATSSGRCGARMKRAQRAARQPVADEGRALRAHRSRRDRRAKPGRSSCRRRHACSSWSLRAGALAVRAASRLIVVHADAILARRRDGDNMDKAEKRQTRGAARRRPSAARSRIRISAVDGRVPADWPADALAIAVADEGAVAGLVRAPRLTTLANLWAARRLDVVNGTLFDLAARRPKARSRAIRKAFVTPAALRHDHTGGLGLHPPIRRSTTGATTHHLAPGDRTTGRDRLGPRDQQRRPAVPARSPPARARRAPTRTADHHRLGSRLIRTGEISTRSRGPGRPGANTAEAPGEDRL